MARAGLLKSEVKHARDAIIARKLYPSADAVRIELGNTGSKSTIHKYLKELEQEDGGGRRVQISEPLQALVEQLAAQLKDEADAEVSALRQKAILDEQRYAEAIADLQGELDARAEKVQQLTEALTACESTARENAAALQQERLMRHKAEQQAADFTARLADYATHLRSIEEKHQHSREALEHYRASVKEQRDQEQRRHEQQVQQLQSELRGMQQSVVVKQDELTRLNQEGARLVSELSHSQRALREEQASNRTALDRLATAERKIVSLEARLGERDTQSARLQQQLESALQRRDEAVHQIHDLELALAQAQTKVETQEALVTELRSRIDGIGRAGNTDPING